MCVLVCLFMAVTSQGGREGEGMSHRAFRAMASLTTGYCCVTAESFGLGESPRGSCVALVCAVWRGVRKGMMKALLGSIDASAATVGCTVGTRGQPGNAC